MKSTVILKQNVIMIQIEIQNVNINVYPTATVPTADGKQTTLRALMIITVYSGGGGLRRRISRKNLTGSKMGPNFMAYF